MTGRPPTLNLADWEATRDSLHVYARILGTIRGRYMPPSKHWWHVTLAVRDQGLTTAPFGISDQEVALTLDLAEHRLAVESRGGRSVALPLREQSAAGVCRWLATTFASAGIELEPALLAAFDDEEAAPYDGEAAERFRRVLVWVDAAFKTFQGGLRGETSPVQVFPHHMDLSMNWFSGRLVPGVDPADAEKADEQLGFGFVTGDGSIPDAYVYATAYPVPDGWTDLELPAGAYWHTDDWTGAVLPYTVLQTATQPLERLLEFLRGMQRHGAARMA